MFREMAQDLRTLMLFQRTHIQCTEHTLQPRTPGSGSPVSSHLTGTRHTHGTHVHMNGQSTDMSKNRYTFFKKSVFKFKL